MANDTNTEKGASVKAHHRIAALEGRVDAVEALINALRNSGVDTETAGSGLLGLPGTGKSTPAVTLATLSTPERLNASIRALDRRVDQLAALIEELLQREPESDASDEFYSTRRTGITRNTALEGRRRRRRISDRLFQRRRLGRHDLDADGLWVDAELEASDA